MRNLFLILPVIMILAGCRTDDSSNGIAEISSEHAPEAIGPYSQAILAGDMLFLSGQIPMDPETGEIVDGDIAVQTRLVLENLEAVLTEAGMDLNNVVKTSVYLTDLDHFDDMNQQYSEYFDQPAPARETVEVSRLPGDVDIEISAIAVK